MSSDPLFLAHQKTHAFWGHLDERSPRADAWRRIYGGLSVPIRGPIPTRALGPDGQEHEFYLVETKLLDDEMKERAAQHCATTFGVPLDEVRAAIAAGVLPILAEGVAAPVPLRFVIDAGDEDEELDELPDDEPFDLEDDR